MNKKSWFACFSCLLLGLAIGYFLTIVQLGKEAAESLAYANNKQIVELGNRAFKAYQHEDRSVAIYAQADYLAALQVAESVGAHDSIFLPETELQRCLMFAHDRLAKLLLDSGQSDASKTHLTEALKYAQGTSKDSRKIARINSITNDS